jgi:hypothetical protein
MDVVSKPGRPLDSLGEFLFAANVRGDLNVHQCFVAPGRGQVGDLVIGCVIPRPGHEITVIDQKMKAHSIEKSQRVVAVLGQRDSSTHVCATIPSGGLNVSDGVLVHWVAGESGIVGCLEREAPKNSIHAAETAVDFRCDGLVVNSRRQPVNIREFAVKPGNSKVSVPIIFVGATSSESGKTVLAGELIRQLSEKGIRVGALKVTGTGGVLDSLHHSRSGAIAVLDNVNAGLISTHCEAAEFRQKIPLIFRQIDHLGADLIVAELGGDLLCANNPEVFSIEELMGRAMMLIVISNDALAAAGVNSINERQLGFPVEKIRHFTSPFRNHAGMARRMNLAGISACFDPRSPVDVKLIVDQITDIIAPELQDGLERKGVRYLAGTE